MLSKVVLAGGNGYLGRVLTEYYRGKAKEIILLVRSQPKQATTGINYVLWDGQTLGEWKSALEGAGLLINLCGKNVNCRYTEKNKQAIFDSRLKPTGLLGKAIQSLVHPPQCWINIASATIYRHAEDRPQTEATGEIGTGFSVDVCTAWEKVFWEAETADTRKVVLRVGLVLGRQDGVFPRIKNLVAAGLGGHQGTGRQYVSWLHEMDFARCVDWIHAHANATGTYNCTAPEAVSNKDFMRVIRKSYGMPVGLPSPQWLLEIGALVIGTESELLLKSRWVEPKRLLDEGFDFSFAKLEPAVREILSART